MRRRHLSAILSLAVIASLGCESGPKSRPKVAYRVSAKENFIKGKKAFDDEDYLEAIEFFRFVKNRFPYSAYATEADLYLADSHFERDRYIEAADAYLSFIKLHPKHAKVGYAMFRIGLCYFERIPDDWWFYPPAYELDQKETLRAIRELEHYLKRFPDDENAPEAKKRLAKAKRRMANKVHYVMHFNRKNGRHRGALLRAEQLLGEYPGTGFDEQALWIKASSLAQLREVAQAKAALTELLKRFPSGEYADDARGLLARLDALDKERSAGGASP